MLGIPPSRPLSPMLTPSCKRADRVVYTTCRSSDNARWVSLRESAIRDVRRRSHAAPHAGRSHVQLWATPWGGDARGAVSNGHDGVAGRVPLVHGCDHEGRDAGVCRRRVIGVLGLASVLVVHVSSSSRCPVLRLRQARPFGVGGAACGRHPRFGQALACLAL